MIITELQPHQKRVVDLIKKYNNLLLHHSMGSGKTLSSIAAADAIGLPTRVVMPASLMANYKKELAKHLTDSSKFSTYSMQGIARNPNKLPEGGMLIVDEAHNVRNPESAIYQALKNKAFNKKILLTGTPIYNSPTDIEALSNLLGNNFKYDKYEPADKSEYPDVINKVIKIKSNPKQKSAFRYYNNKIEENLNRFIKKLPNEYLRYNKIPNKDYFSNVTRQIANTLRNFYINRDVPKVKQIIQDIEKRPGKTLVYSNYLGSGLNLIENRLRKLGIPFGTFTGETTKRNKKLLVDQYNQDKLPVLLVSSSGTEGLDLKGTRQVLITEPHWNEPKINQLIGRAIRFRSHADLPKNERKVIIKRYIDTASTPTADEKLYELAKKKKTLGEMFMRKI